MKKLLLAVCVVFTFAVSSFAVNGIPFKLSLWENLSIPKNADSICGLQVGIGDYTADLVGVGLNFIYSRTDTAKGWIHGAVTISKQFTGVQQGYFFSMSETVTGLCTGMVNWNEGAITGVQFGLFNIAESVTGVQFGFINMTENMYGVQIGLINFIRTSSLPVMVIANAKF